MLHCYIATKYKHNLTIVALKWALNLYHHTPNIHADGLQSMLNDIEKKIQKQRLRLELQPNDSRLSSSGPPQNRQQEEKIEMLTAKINKLVEEVEELGTKGQVRSTVRM